MYLKMRKKPAYHVFSQSQPNTSVTRLYMVTRDACTRQVIINLISKESSSYHIIVLFRCEMKTKLHLRLIDKPITHYGCNNLGWFYSVIFRASPCSIHAHRTTSMIRPLKSLTWQKEHSYPSICRI